VSRSHHRSGWFLDTSENGTPVFRVPEEVPDAEEQNEREWPRPEQTQSFRQQTQNEQNSRELQPSLHGVGAQYHGPPFENFTSLRDATLCCQSIEQLLLFSFEEE